MNGNKTVKYEYINSSKNQFNLKEYMFNRATNNAVGSNKNGVLDIEKYKDNNDTYKILADINSRLISTDNMHMVKILRDIEFEVKNMYNQNTPILYYQDIITDFLNSNAIHMEKIKKLFDDNWDLPDTDTLKTAFFISLVKTGGDFDLKSKKEWQYPYTTYHGELANKTMNKFMYFDGKLWSGEMLGNMSFGYLGGAYGYNEEFLCFGAGLYQIKDHKIKALLQFNTWSYGDDPRDTFQIRMGYNMYKKGRLKDK